MVSNESPKFRATGYLKPYFRKEYPDIELNDLDSIQSPLKTKGSNFEENMNTKNDFNSIATNGNFHNFIESIESKIHNNLNLNQDIYESNMNSNFSSSQGNSPKNELEINPSPKPIMLGQIYSPHLVDIKRQDELISKTIQVQINEKEKKSENIDLNTKVKENNDIKDQFKKVESFEKNVMPENVEIADRIISKNNINKIVHSKFREISCNDENLYDFNLFLCENCRKKVD